MCCECNKYEHIELYRESINQRIKKSRTLKQKLKEIAQSIDGEHTLWQCPVCSQFWQSSYAWNWGQKFYLFKIPSIAIDEWLLESYVQPDELLIFAAMMRNYLDSNSSEEIERKCRAEYCEKNAVKFTVFCLSHHIESLQRAEALPKYPKGKWFLPYQRF
jgi:hypothetical protein